MPTRKQNTIGAIQCTQCGGFIRSKKDSACPRCCPSSRVQRRMMRKQIKKSIRRGNRAQAFCIMCGVLLETWGCPNKGCIAHKD